ncbi:MAG TPA: ribosomal protein S18-alanine N-acetyltransferase [Spirochaetota bacterium]|nr:ribosomal protein S18-alanine N-acetyltransferase [Spirochaetota bacterium]HPJ42021.1 ribosomal protein S18-alanine N-acetyltransferase [Spirochaetota bacterium]HPR36187.1 ribosomal protein S18-alanine N-acetyltransferase [Spirochaetota bacterium]
MIPVIIRKAVFTDLQQVCEIEAESIKSWTYNQFAEELGRTFSCFIVAEQSGLITGYAIAWIIAGELQINSIAVKNNYKRLGLGRMMLDYLINSNSSEKISAIYIDVRKNNTNALNFYKSSGFIETGLRKNYYGDDDAILMEKKIT